MARLRGPVGGDTNGLGPFKVGSEVDELAPGVDVNGVEDVGAGGIEPRNARGPVGGAFPLIMCYTSSSRSSSLSREKEKLEKPVALNSTTYFLVLPAAKSPKCSLETKCRTKKDKAEADDEKVGRGGRG